MRPIFLSQRYYETMFYQKFMGNTFGLKNQMQNRFKSLGGHCLTSDQCSNQFELA